MGKDRKSFEVTKADGTKVEIKQRSPEDFKEYKDLPTWVRTAVVMVEVLGISQAEAAKRHGKSGNTLSNYFNRSPAAKKWAEECKDISLDSQKMAQMVINSSSLGVSLEYFAAYQKAIEAGDYANVAKISQDMLDRAGVTKKKERSDEKIQVTLNITGGMDVPQIEASYEEILEDDEYDVS